MKILALEFSSSQRSVAAVSSGLQNGGFHELQTPGNSGGSDARAVCFSGQVVNEVIETGAGATNALGMVDEALRAANLEREQIECLAVGLGPGSYTGIRAAIALAQGWHLACRVKLIGISSVECLAAQAHAEGLTGPINIIIDAQRNEFYLARYEVSDREWREIEPLRLATLAGLQERERAGELLAGPEVTRWFAKGRPLFPRAAMLGQLALSRNSFVAGDKLEPVYLREITFVKAPPPRVLP